MKKPERPPVLNDNESAINASILEFLFKNNNEKGREIQIIKENYPYWEEFRQKVKSWNYDTTALWAYIKDFRKNYKTVYFFPGIEFIKFLFRYNTTNNIQRQLHEFDLGFGGVLLSSDRVDDEDKEQYLLSSLMEEAIASSQLEGAVTTREVAKEMLLQERKPRNYSEKMIANNYQAIKKILEWKGKSITKERILELHAIITKDTLDDERDAGRFRSTDNVNVVDDISGEIFYTPPSNVHLDILMNEFCLFANEQSGGGFIHPIIRGIILHFLIGYIHPFTDGNGRTARAIFYWFLINKGYWMIEYMSISRIILRSPAKYARAYLHTEYDDNDLTYFIIYNLDAMEKAMEELKVYIKRKIAEKKQMHTLLVDTTLNDRQLAILKDAMDNTEIIITIKEVQNKYGVVYQTARTDMMKLTEEGYFEMKTTGKKQIFYRSKQFDKLIKKKK